MEVFLALIGQFSAKFVCAAPFLGSQAAEKKSRTFLCEYFFDFLLRRNKPSIISRFFAGSFD
jgi:hypothetical protein